MHDGQRRCNRCKKTKHVGDYFRNGKSREGYTSQCKTCLAELARRRRRRRLGLPEDTPRMRATTSGDISLGADGYVRVKEPDHHRARRGWTYQHILVAEQKYGIAITSDFTVHHRDGNRSNNDPANLELRYGRHGKGADVIPALLRLPEMRAVARAVLASYDD